MTEPIRVCQIVGNMTGGGVEHVVLNYFKHVDRHRIQFDFVITQSSTVVPREEIESLGGRIFFIPPIKHLSDFQESCYDLFIQHPEWKIVHSHMNTLSVFPLKMAMKAGVPIRIAHSHSAYGKGEPLRNMAKRILRRRSKAYSTHRIACGKNAGDWLFGKTTPYSLVYNAIELEKFYYCAEDRERTRAELHISPESFVIGHVGRFVQTKNHIFLVDAFDRLLKQRPDSVLCLVGTGETKKAVEEKVVSLGISDKVRFLGQQDDVNHFYQAFDTLALPSLYEGVTVVGVEAQASGLPCFFSDRVSHEIDLSESSRHYSLHDPQIWADALVGQKTRTERERTNINQELLRNYDIKIQGDVLTNYYLNIYEDIS